MSSVNKTDFNFAFKKVCTEFNVSSDIEKDLGKAIWEHFNNHREAIKIASTLFFDGWVDSSIIEVLSYLGRNHDSDEQIKFIIDRTCRIANIKRQMRDMLLSVRAMPFVTICKGINFGINECPEHQKIFDTPIPVYNFVNNYSLINNPKCNCHIRLMSKFEFEKQDSREHGESNEHN